MAAAAKARGLAREVVGAARRSGPLERALAAGIVDSVAAPAEAVIGADLVVLGTPVGSMERVLSEVGSALSPGCLVTDVGSVKGAVVDRLPGLLPEGVIFVGSHPMAGSHLRGPDHARADLFEGATCVVTPVKNPSGIQADELGKGNAAVERIESLWRSLGARSAPGGAGAGAQGRRGGHGRGRGCSCERAPAAALHAAGARASSQASAPSAPCFGLAPPGRSAADRRRRSSD